MLWSILGGVVFAAGGTFIYLKPDLVWKLTEKWKSYGADKPSDFYLKSTRFGGALFVAFGVALMILPFLLE